jgi:two-component system cell cycle response regulator
MHEIRAVSGEDASSSRADASATTRGLVSMVLENRHPLPYRGEYDPAADRVHEAARCPRRAVDRGAAAAGPRSPARRAGARLRRASRLQRRRARTLEVLASHMAVSLSNARMLRRLEELATTDGLTGLLNKRAMLEVAEQKMRSRRALPPALSVLITDIDHFKKVNDTYGHDVGDVVIKGLGDILSRAKRNTDAVARFGGEEFVIICEETDARGAMLLAERVREELGRTTFHTPSGPRALNVTCSLGVATFPEAGDDVGRAVQGRRRGALRVEALGP